jgi:hypothetical protein
MLESVALSAPEFTVIVAASGKVTEFLCEDMFTEKKRRKKSNSKFCTIAFLENVKERARLRVQDCVSKDIQIPDDSKGNVYHHAIDYLEVTRIHATKENIFSPL